MKKHPFARIQSMGAFCWTAKYVLLVVLAGTLMGCGSASEPIATAKFCNDLYRNGNSYVGYLDIVGDGISDTWYATSGTCTPCRAIPAETTLAFEYGDDDIGMSLFNFTDVLYQGGEYAFYAEPNPVTDAAEFNTYEADSYHVCEDL